MNYTKVLGKCLSTSCQKKSLGKCHNFSLGGETSSACGYCGCSEGAHQLVGHIPLANQAPPVVPQTPVPPTPPRTPVEGPKLHQRALLIAERKKIFETAPSVPTKKSSPKKRSLIDMMNSSKKQRKEPVILADTVENRILDRADALKEAPEGVTQTDLDVPEQFKINGVWWMPVVFGVDKVEDLSRYCYTCKTQLKASDRQECATCHRFTFVECGHFGPSDEDDPLNPSNVFPMDHYRCCHCCKPESNYNEYREYFESLPPRRSTEGRFSSEF